MNLLKIKISISIKRIKYNLKKYINYLKLIFVKLVRKIIKKN